MATGVLASALEREHREIDDGIEAFAAGVAAGEPRPEPLLRAFAALRRHIYLEETFLFPALRDAGLVAPVVVMLREHGRIWRTMDAVGAQVGAGGVGAAVRETCHVLAVQLQHHNLKEERILYPRVDEVVSEAAHAELTAFIESGRLPEGWVCERAAASGHD